MSHVTPEYPAQQRHDDGSARNPRPEQEAIEDSVSTRVLFTNKPPKRPLFACAKDTCVGRRGGGRTKRWCCVSEAVDMRSGLSCRGATKGKSEYLSVDGEDVVECDSVHLASIGKEEDTAVDGEACAVDAEGIDVGLWREGGKEGREGGEGEGGKEHISVQGSPLCHRPLRQGLTS